MPHKNQIKINKFHFLKCWMFSFVLRAEGFMEASGFWSSKPQIRIRIRIRIRIHNTASNCPIFLLAYGNPGMFNPQGQPGWGQGPMGGYSGKASTIFELLSWGFGSAWFV
jgi:hypothetical protein